MGVFQKIFDSNLKETLQKASVAFIIRSGGLIFNFIFNVYLARFFGAEGAGVYYLAFTIITVFALISRFGLDNVLVKNIAIYYSNQQFDKIKGLYVYSVLVTLSLSLIFTLVIFFTASQVSIHIFHEPKLVEPLRYMSLTILPFSLLNIGSALHQGIKNIRDAILVNGALIPFFLLVIILIIRDSYGIEGVIIAYFLSSVLVFVYAIWRWHLKVPGLMKHSVDFNTRLMLKSSFPMLGIALMNLLIMYSNTFFLGVYVDTELVGIFNIALRVATLTSLLLVAMNSIIAPQFAVLYQNKDMRGLEKLARNSSFFIGLASGVVLLFFVLFPEFVLSLFGEEFKGGKMVLIIISIGQFVNSATGSVGYLLMMTGNEKLMRNNITFIALLSVMLNIILIPRLNILGAALTTAFCMALMNIISVIIVYKKTALLVIPVLDRR
jgi:O-antigen/teichoic acid export membrane protein